MASDSEATESVHTRYDVEKIWATGGLLMGYSGSGSVRQPLVAAIDKAVTTLFGTNSEVDRWEARSGLRQAVNPVLTECYQHHLGARDGHGIPEALKGVLLVIGRDAVGYWMLEIDYMVQASFYTDTGFHTIGSGAAAAYMAQSMMKDYDASGRSVSQLKLIAYRTVQTCIDTLGGAMGVGGHVEIWSSEDNSAFARVPLDEIEAIENGVEQWRGVERESLGQVVAPVDAPLPDEGIPLPGPLSEASDEGNAAGTNSQDKPGMLPLE